MAVVHLARFGARSGEHALLAHTGAARELLDEAVWRTDVPPQGDADTMGTFVTGYRLDDHYVVQRTTPDPTAERSGMVTTTSVFLPISLVGVGRAGAAVRGHRQRAGDRRRPRGCDSVPGRPRP